VYDFDSVSKATRLENEIRELWQQYAKLQNMRDAYRHNRDRYNESQMAKRMNILTLDMNHAIRLWGAETGKQWTIWHYRATEPDPVTTAAWDTLGQSLNAQLDTDMQEVVDVLTVWEYIKENGGGITRPSVIVFPEDEAAEVKRFERFENGRTNANVTAAASWIRQQEGA